MSELSLEGSWEDSVADSSRVYSWWSDLSVSGSIEEIDCCAGYKLILGWTKYVSLAMFTLLGCSSTR